VSHGLAPALHASQPVPQKLGFMGSESSKPFNDSDPFIGRPESRQECRSYRAVPPSTALLYRLVGTPSGAILIAARMPLLPGAADDVGRADPWRPNPIPAVGPRRRRVAPLSRRAGFLILDRTNILLARGAP